MLASGSHLTLWDIVLRFDSSWFIRAQIQLTKLEQEARSINPGPLDPGLADSVAEAFEQLRASSLAHGLILTGTEAARILAICKNRGTMEQLRDRMKEFQQRIVDELQAVTMVQIDPSRTQFYEGSMLFGESVRDKFPSAIIDVEEAGNCLALECWTAAVFHLMRTIEAGLRVLAASLHDDTLDPKRNPSWDAILRKCRTELDKPLRDRSAEWREDDAFFSGAVVHLSAIKDAWRNPTMHVELNYNQHSAMDVWNSVGAFMRHLATRLAE